SGAQGKEAAAMMTFAAAVLVKATVVTLAALAATRLARRTRAAVRHVLLAATFAVLLALPLASLVVPSIAVPLPVRAPVRIASWQAERFAVTDPTGIRTGRGGGFAAEATTPSSRWPSWSSLGGVAWAAGLVLFLLPVATGLLEARRLRRTGLPWRPGQAVVDSLAHEAAPRRGVDVLLHERVAGPVTCGAARPAILLPIDARRWDEESLRRAIVHELEHVRRGDWLTQSIARAASAL